jgi:hypothetical protein
VRSPSPPRRHARDAPRPSRAREVAFAAATAYAPGVKRLALAWVVLSACGSACGPLGSKGVERGQTATSLAVGGMHACLGLLDGTLRCFGSNASGQLGSGAQADAPDGSTASDAPPSAPRVVPGLADVRDVAAGGAHTCARLGDGTVRCFGANDFGQLGDGSTAARPRPVILPGLRGATALSAGGAHTCALGGDRAVWCWGRNDDGQLGDGSTTSRASPVRVASLDDVEQLAAGTFHTCARRRDGSVWCWGRNDAGQVGDGTKGTRRPRATEVLGVGATAAIAAGLEDSCAVLADRSLRCWGKAAGSASATALLGFSDVAEVSIGASATSLQLCARLSGGAIRCASDGKAAPTLVPGLVSAARIAGGAAFSCALLSDGSTRCWPASGAAFPVIP